MKLALILMTPAPFSLALLSSPLLNSAQEPEVPVLPELAEEQDFLDPASMIEGAAAELAPLGYNLGDGPVSVSQLARSQAVGPLIQESERALSAEYIELLVRLNEMFRFGKLSSEELRQEIGRLGASQYLAYYEPVGNELVFLTGELNDDDPLETTVRNPFGVPEEFLLESVVLHELVHAWRDRQIDLGEWTAGRGRSRDEAVVRACLSEGEAQIVATAALLARTGQDLSIVPTDAPLQVTLGSLSLLLPYEFGQRLQLRKWNAGGFEAVRKSFEEPLTSSEQVLHATKEGVDLPREVPVPSWPAEGLGEAELVHADTLGELTSLAMLLEAGASVVEARVAGCGWDGDSIALYRTPKEDVVVWRSVWDRPEDAEQFAKQLERHARGDAQVRGQIVDWVSAKRKSTRNALLEHLAGEVFEVEFSEDDARTTELAEEVLDTSRSRLKDGRWLAPDAGLSMAAPDGWELDEVNGITLLRDEPKDGFADNFTAAANVVPESTTIEEVEKATVEQLEAFGLSLLASEIVERSNGERWYEFEYSGSMGEFDLHWLGQVVLHDGQQRILTATVLETRWEAMEALVRESLTQVEVL